MLLEGPIFALSRILGVMPLSRDRSGALLISRTSLLHTGFCATVLCLSSLFVSYKVFSTLIRSDAKSFEIVRVVSYAAQQANVAAVALMLLQGKYRKLLLFCQWAQNMKINNTTIQHCKLPTTFYFFLHTTSDIFNVYFSLINDEYEPCDMCSNAFLKAANAALTFLRYSTFSMIALQFVSCCWSLEGGYNLVMSELKYFKNCEFQSSKIEDLRMRLRELHDMKNLLNQIFGFYNLTYLVLVHVNLHLDSFFIIRIIHGVDRASMISFAKRITFYWILDDGVRAVAILLGSTQVKTKIDQIELRLRKMVNELDPSNRIENKNIISLFHETALNNTSLSACDVFQIDVNMIAIAAASILTNVAIMFQSFLSVKTLGN